jgi:hypothetical protein
MTKDPKDRKRWAPKDLLRDISDTPTAVRKMNEIDQLLDPDGTQFEEFFSYKEEDDICKCGSPAQQAVYSLLQENQFRLVRSNTHDVWKHPISGLTWVTPKTPSDHRGWKNNFSDLKSALTGRQRHKTLRQHLDEDEIISADEALRRDNKRRRPN